MLVCLMPNVFPIPAFTDNYIWCIHNSSDAIVIDPGDATPVLEYLRLNNLNLCTILITHHHADHIGGVKRLTQEFENIKVVGPKSERIPHSTLKVAEGDRFTVPQLALDFEVMEVPAHTLDHIAYYNNLGLFCGDTLFSGGCGRLFEGTPTQMLENLNRFAQLPAETKVYCTHEYTTANMRFALAVLPEDKAFKDYSEWVRMQRSQNLPTLPSSIGQELKINPFMRSNDKNIQKAAENFVGKPLNSDNEVFTAIRSWKDQF